MIRAVNAFKSELQLLVKQRNTNDLKQFTVLKARATPQ